MNKQRIKYIIIRDDDIIPYSRRDMIEPLYEDFFKQGLSVSFSVIPDVNINQRNDSNGPYSPFKEKFGIAYPAMVPPEYRGTGKRREWDDNQELLDWFAGMGRSVEILQHGYDHAHIGRRNEFGIYDRELAAGKLERGLAIIEKYFNCRPEFFVAPRDAVTLACLKEIQNRFKGISLWKFDKFMSIAADIKRCFSLKTITEDIQAFALIQKIETGCFFWDDFMICTHPGYIFARLENYTNIETQFHRIMKTADVFVLVNHYWEYFFDWNKLDKDYFALWKKLSKKLLEREDCRVVSFKQLHEIMSATGSLK